MDVDDEPYGSSKSCLTILNYLSEINAQNVSFCSLNKKGVLYAHCKKMGMSCGYINSKWKDIVEPENSPVISYLKIIKIIKFFIEKLYSLFYFIFFIFKNKPDVIYINTSVSSWPALCGMLCRKRVVLHMRESGENLIKKGKLRLFKFDVFSCRRLIFKICVGKFIAVSKHTKKFLKKTLGDVDITVLYNHIAYNDFHQYQPSQNSIKEDIGLDGNKKIVSCITRIDKLKGIDDLIEIALRCQETMPNICFLVIGGPTTSKFFIDEIHPQFESMKNILHIPFQSDVRNFYAISDIILNPSKAEAFGRTNIEAMAMGKCVIARAVDAIPEIITSGQNGFLFPKDDISKIPSLIKDLLENEKLRTQIGVNAQKTVSERFSSEVCIEKLYDFLSKA